MKLKYNFEIIALGDDVVAVPVGRDASAYHGVVKLNKAGQEIMELLKKQTTVEQITDILDTRYENDKKDLEIYVNSFIETLRFNDLLTE